MNDGRPPAIRFSDVVKRYAAGAAAVNGVSFDVPEGKFVVIVGPSGCGKTTLLKMVNRLHEPSSGAIWVNGEDVASLPATQLRRRIGYVIQQVGLFPHFTVEQNIAVVPQLLGWDAARVRARVAELLDLVHLPSHEYLDRFPRQLSGGQQQRVGLARALAADPAILLMDEPFGAVDAIERAHLQDEMAALESRVQKTVLFVTHDVDEALRLGDRIVVMRDGAVEQYDTPLHVLARPATPFVASLLGAEDALRRLSVVRAGDVMTEFCTGASPPAAPEIADRLDVRSALSRLIAAGSDELVVVNEHAAPVGVLTLGRIREVAMRRETAETETP